jgi:hypothetical protein
MRGSGTGRAGRNGRLVQGGGDRQGQPVFV